MQSTQSLRNENQCLESYVEVQLRAIALGNDILFHQKFLSDLEAYNTSARKEREKKKEKRRKRGLFQAPVLNDQGW